MDCSKNSLDTGHPRSPATSSSTRVGVVTDGQGRWFELDQLWITSLTETELDHVRGGGVLHAGAARVRLLDWVDALLFEQDDEWVWG